MKTLIKSSKVTKAAGGFVLVSLFSLITIMAAEAATDYLAKNANTSDYAVSFNVASGGTSEAYFEFDYPPRTETFVIKLTDPAQIQQARDILAGKIRDTVHIIGNIIKEPAGYNTPWNYYLSPDSVSFFESATEVCDAGIQYVEDHLAEVGGSFLPGNSWCPWGSRLLQEVSGPTPHPDTTPPTVSITSPKDGVTVSGTITVSATAADNVGVAGLQFKLDGANQGAEDTASPYELTLDTTILTNGTHTLSATAKDAAGNSATSSLVTIRVDTQPPTTPTNLQAAAISSTQINLSWTASTDNVGVAGYKIYRDTIQIATTRQGTVYSDTGLTPSTTYTYTVSAYDAAGNESGQSNVAAATTLPPSDFTPPAVSLTFPVNNLAVAGIIPVSAAASDNVGVSGVQFKLDGANLGLEDRFAPYSISWDTVQVLDGSFTLTAVARDAEGNTTTSQAIIVRTDNIDNTGDYYDNRDGNHARLNLSSYPNVTYISSGYGGQLGMVADKVVAGNSSTAFVSGEMWGSNVRVNFMRNPYGVDSAYSQYTNNNAYWYPEHRDHDETDYYFAQTPTVNSSQGSSGTELDEVGKWLRALAAFKPEVRELLKNRGLLMPTIQMIARRARVASDEEYLNGAAHPNAFDNLDNRAQMEEMASAMEAGNVPPMVKIAVVEDGFTSKPTEDFFESGFLVNSEKIYDTAVSIARTFRGREYTKRIVVSAADSFDVNSRPLSFHWKALRGDPAHIQINPLNPEGSEVEILFDYHPQSVIEGSTRNTNLVSVGVFAYNGVYYSAPAFVTSYTLNNEVREYDAETKRLLKITYNSNYVDPYLTTAKSWESDTYQYDAQGALTGWARMKAGQTYDFTKEGYLVVEKDSEGKVIQASLVSYSKDATTKKIVWQAIGQPFDYPDITPPSAPTNFTVTAVSSSQINLSWAASTDNVGVVGYKIYRDGTLVTTSQGHNVTSYTDTGLTASTTYTYTVLAYDAEGNESAQSQAVSATTLALPDALPPEVSITSPLSGATVSGTISIQAAATDNLGVVGVQFLLDGANLQAEDITSPYFVSWDTTTIANGAHMLTAVARDAAGNSAASSAVSITVNNDFTAPVISAVLSSWITSNSAIITWTTDEPATSQVEYGTSRNYGKLTPLDRLLVTRHKLRLTGLSPGIIYHYRVRSKDAAGNEAVSRNFYFTTKRASYMRPPAKNGVGLWSKIGYSDGIIARK